ncbi:ABC-2 type transport system ATP-binding protein [Natronobacillus azotifigens]|uniref:ABC transporter ATP-binding protein n=1 Tax=Natronobacillus azotifigens TaxID=472978 RepID=A0A9J6R9H9_9BACI|nr:ABC transporter ATP-binding protein [Natronobacillus azotifigens]MCZ0702261.1 ABC transporter ATP-binding protein [Natronobacillus azotifigens]
MENILSVKSLKHVFSKSTAIDNMSFEVQRGEIFGFLGPSGAGKTTTIKILTGQLHPTSGTALLFDVPSTQVNQPKYLKKFGVMTDNSGLYNRLSVYDNLHLYCELYSVENKQKRIDEVLDMVNLMDEKRKVVSKLSKGMLQRVTLARALLHEPELLFLDEPTGALDPANSRHIHHGLQELNRRGTTIFLTTHDMLEAESLCHRVAFLNKGKVQLLDEPSKLRRKYSDDTLTVELVTGEKRILENGPKGAQKLYEYMSSGQVVTLFSNEPTLGDIFVDVTGRSLV